MPVSPLFASCNALRNGGIRFLAVVKYLAKSGLTHAAKPALRDTAGKPQLFFWCRGQHPQVLSQRSDAGRSKRAPGGENSSLTTTGFAVYCA